MTNVEYQTKILIREIRRSNEYNQYQRLKKKLNKDQELCTKVNEYRKRCFWLQNKTEEASDIEQLKQLAEEYKGILTLAPVNEFLISEQRLCRMMSRMVTSIEAAMDFDMDFMK